MISGQFFLCALLYVLAARGCLAWTQGRWRTGLFALLNILGIWCLFHPSPNFNFPLRLGAYIALVAVQYIALNLFAQRKGWWPWIAFFTPLVALVLIKYVPALFEPIWVRLGWKPMGSFAEYFVGISYLAFRTSHLVLEVRNGVVPKPDFWEYLGYSFFVPTMLVGPINPYSQYQKGFAGPDRTELPLGRCALRVLIGATKFIFLASLCNQLSYAGLLLDGHPHHWVDLVVAAVFYYLYLYCNFSGFCDMAIGVAGLLGFPVAENFRNPFAARNLQEFWNRWHITLSRYMRDVLFTPLSKWLINLLGVSRTNAAIAIAIFVVFLLIGVWHGLGWNYAAFGAAHGFGLVVVHYYGLGLKQWLGKERFRSYLQNGWVRAIATGVTFSYVTACLFLFANDFATMRKIFSVIV